MIREYKLCLMVDGENVIFPCDFLAQNHEEALGIARERLGEIAKAVRYVN